MSETKSRSTTVVNSRFEAMDNRPRPRTRRSRSNAGDSRPSCEAVDVNGTACGETKTLSITEELKRLYENRLKQLDEASGTPANSDQLQVKVGVLNSWVKDLLEQNAELVHTVEELEREIALRVKLLEQKLTDSARACQEYMSSLQNYDTETDKDELARKNALIEQLQAELRSLKQRSYDSDKDGEMAKLREHLQLKDSQIRALIQRIQELREDIQKKSGAVTKLLSRNTTDVGTMTDEKMGGSYGVTMQSCSSTNKCYDDSDLWRGKTSASYPEVLHGQYELQQMEMITIARQNDNLLAKQLEEAEIFLEISIRDKERLTDEVDFLHKQLNDQGAEIRNLAKSLSDTEKVSRDMQSALTNEVAKKHDIIMMLRQDNFDLQENITHIDMQTRFKDNIIKELRKDLKQARSKITVMEQELLEKSYNADKNRRFSSSPELGQISPVPVQSRSQVPSTYEPNIHQEQELSTKPPACGVCQDTTLTGRIVHAKTTQCDLSKKTPKMRSRGTRLHRHSISDCSPSAGHHCGDVSPEPLATDSRVHISQRSSSPPCKDVHRAGRDPHDHPFPYSAEEVRQIRGDAPSPSKHHRAHLSSAWHHGGK